MSKPDIDDGGSAFPKPCEFDPFGNQMPDGMSVRQLYAALAMQTLVDTKAPTDLRSLPLDVVTSVVATAAFQFADAMIAHEREETPDGQ